jgi:hypothetical protein
MALLNKPKTTDILDMLRMHMEDASNCEEYICEGTSNMKGDTYEANTYCDIFQCGESGILYGFKWHFVNGVPTSTNYEMSLCPNHQCEYASTSNKDASKDETKSETPLSNSDDSRNHLNVSSSIHPCVVGNIWDIISNPLPHTLRSICVINHIFFPNDVSLGIAISLSKDAPPIFKLLTTTKDELHRKVLVSGSAIIYASLQHQGITST